MPGLLLETLHGKSGSRRPVWLMRQAGRYLPEYRALRSEKGGFLELVYDSEAAAEITLQPVRRFGFDGAILFSDILIVPYAMGQDLAFLAGEGPQLSPPLIDTALGALEAVPERLDPIYRTVALVREQLGPETTLLGFAGSPWTVATYMVAGEGSRDQHVTRALAYHDPGAFQAIVDAIVAVTVEYLCRQIEAGAEAVQLFDSWAGSLSPDQFERWVVAPNSAIADAVNTESLRLQVRSPLVLTETLDKFDIVATTSGGGISGMAGALRLGIARALCLYNAELRGRLKKAGLLTRDQRAKERKKYGLAGARKRFQFSKR